MPRQVTLIIIFIYMIICFLLTSCNEVKSEKKKWPPPLLPEMSYSDSQFQFQIEGLGYIYSNSSMTSKTDIWGVLAAKGEFVIPYNLFKIAAPSDLGFTPNIYEVIYYDSVKTQIKLIQERGDKLLLMYDPNAPPGRTITGITADFAGSKILYGSRVFDLRKDGWYENDTLLHSFANIKN